MIFVFLLLTKVIFTRESIPIKPGEFYTFPVVIDKFNDIDVTFECLKDLHVDVNDIFGVLQFSVIASPPKGSYYYSNTESKQIMFYIEIFTYEENNCYIDMVEVNNQKDYNVIFNTISIISLVICIILCFCFCLVGFISVMVIYYYWILNKRTNDEKYKAMK